MILEAAHLYVTKGDTKQFETDFKQAGKFISSVDGYIRHSLSRCLEQHNKYLLLVEWRELDDHTTGFRNSEAYLHWKALLHHYYHPFPVVEHYELLIENN